MPYGLHGQRCPPSLAVYKSGWIPALVFVHRRLAYWAHNPKFHGSGPCSACGSESNAFRTASIFFPPSLKVQTYLCICRVHYLAVRYTCVLLGSRNLPSPFAWLKHKTPAQVPASQPHTLISIPAPACPRGPPHCSVLQYKHHLLSLSSQTQFCYRRY